MSADGARRTEILETAARLFASSGLRTSLKQIADACGILPGSLYHHFESKEAIVVELIERYRADLDEIAKRALDDLPGPEPAADKVTALCVAVAACGARHRAAVLQSPYEPPSGAGDELVRVARLTPTALEGAMRETLRAGRDAGEIRPGIDLDALAERLCETMLYISLGDFHGVRGADQLPAVRCRIMLDGVAADPPSAARLDRSAAFRAAEDAIAGWDAPGAEEDERVTRLRAVARAEFGRRGYEATTIRDIAAAAGVSTGSVYRTIGSKDELLASIMGTFPAAVRDGWRRVLAADATSVEKLDALMWVNVNVVLRFSDEYNIQLAWLRESPPSTADLGQNFPALMGDLKALLARGTRAGELHIDGPSADIRAWSLFDPLWMHEGGVRRGGPRAALTLGRETVLRGAAVSRPSARRRPPGG
ncbi:MAG TPA: TetR/AcrR family transcriptional regulator [Acidimicrobiales bacterium]|nr:TetR/AcrR family transcriptional regulator [Acidimicrobiales bacterium]